MDFPSANRPRLRRIRLAALLLGSCLAAASLCPAAVATPAAQEEPFHLVILPDTQYYYNDQRAGNFSKWLSQVTWIRNNAEALNLRYVIHTGDITDQADHSTTHLAQWKSARTLTNGIIEKVPLALVTGNHDGLHDTHTTLFSQPEYFGPGSPYASQPTLVEVMEDGQFHNSAHRFTAGGRSWLVLCLEWAARDKVADWAFDVISRYPDDWVIVDLHAYLFRDSSRYDWSLLGGPDFAERQSGNPIGYADVAVDPEGVNDGQLLWNKVFRHFPNVKLIICGHVSRSGMGRRVAINDARHFVAQHLVNFQHWTGDGNGRMRLLEFLPHDGGAFHVTSFSPYDGEVLTGPDLDFVFSLSEQPLALSYRQALRDLGPDFHFSLAGADPRRPVLANDDSFTVGLADGFTGSSMEAFEAGTRLAIPLPQPLPDDWTLTLWFHAADQLAAMPVAAVADGGLEIRADTLPWDLKPLDAAHQRLAYDGESGVLSVRLEPGRWHHLAFACSAGQLTTVVDGEVLPAVALPQIVSSKLILGDAGTLPGLLGETSWQLRDIALHARRLTTPELEWLWRSAFCEPAAGRVLPDRNDLGLLTGLRTRSGDPPGLTARMEPAGQLLFGAAETAIYRIQNTPGASRDPHSRHLRMSRTIEYSDGVLLVNALADDPGDTPSPLPAVEWKVWNRIEKTYFGSAYETTDLSVLNTPLPADSGGLSALFLPFAGDWRGGHVSADQALVYGHHEVEDQLAVSAPSAAVVELTPPEGWRDLVLLAQTALSGTAVSVAPTAGGWLVSGWDAASAAARTRVPFSFVLLPREADGLRSGWFDPGLPADPGSPWSVAGPGVNRFSVPAGLDPDGILVVSPGSPAAWRVRELEPGLWEVRSDAAGQAAPAPFAWAWFNGPQTQRVPQTEPDALVLAVLADAAYADHGWYFSRSGAWLNTGGGAWPWAWSVSRGWIYFLQDSAGPDGCWTYEHGSRSYLYLSFTHPGWAYSASAMEWVPWNPQQT